MLIIALFSSQFYQRTGDLFSSAWMRKFKHGSSHGFQLVWVFGQNIQRIQQVIVEALIFQHDRGAAACKIVSIHFLVAPGVWIRHQNSRQGKKWILSQGTRSGSRNHQIRSSQRRAHLMQIRHHMITPGQFHGQAITRTFDNLPVSLAAKMNDLELCKQPFQVIQNSLVDRMRTFAPTEYQKDRGFAGDAEMLMGCLLIPKREVWAEWVSSLVNTFIKELLRLIRCHSDDVCKSRQGF